MKTIEIKELVKRYKELLALDHFNLEVREGEILGFLGPNGCGKTTAINCMLGLLTYDKGDIRVFGEAMVPNAYHIKKNIGLVPQELAYFEQLTVYENIDFFCGLYIKDKQRRKNLVEEAISFVGLEDYRKFFPNKLSGGLKRRLNIACGIAHRPKLIFLDEPTVAVDAQSRNFILEGIKRLQELFAKGKIIINPACVNLITELESYAWKDGKDEPVKEFDHLVDATRYYITRKQKKQLVAKQRRY